ncbi:MAG: MerR family DNA-binding transcriptional regulator [Pseudomonadota bacterium]
MPDSSSSSISIAENRGYSISELAREFGITPRALRFYEDKDMLHPARDGMTRVYSHRDRVRVSIIVRLKRLGLPLADIRDILDLYGVDEGNRAQTRMLLVKFQKQVSELEAQREDIELALQQLHAGIVHLEDALSRSGPAESDVENVRAYDAVARRQLDDA